MAIITGIKKQQRGDRMSVYLDGKYAFGLSTWQLLDAKLRIGQDLTPEEVDAIQSNAAFGKLYDKTLSWCLMRPRSTWELEQYLYKKTDEKSLRADVQEKIVQKGYIDDESFARSWLESRRLHKSMSKRKLSLELRSKRVSDDIIQKVLQEDETTDQDTIVALIEKKRRITRYQDDQKLMRYLVGQGYSYDDIKRAIEADD